MNHSKVSRIFNKFHAFASLFYLKTYSEIERPGKIVETDKTTNE